MAGLEWKMVRSSAADLEQALNDLQSEGYEIARIIAGDDQAQQISISSAHTRESGDFVVVGKKQTTF